MNEYSNRIHEHRDAFDIGSWENEGGAPGRGDNRQYGRRVEGDRSWTVYHVFTGIPAKTGGRTLIGLSRSDATDRMMSLNLGNARRRNERLRLDAPTLDVPEIGEIRP